ncbi:MAG: T9SS type A sorting domain-containing protein [Saprospiraceae bacterium]
MKATEGLVQQAVTVNDIPTCLITGNNTICTGGSTQLCAADGAESYIWSTGETTQCITVDSAGTFTVIVTNLGGCSSICYKIITTSTAPNCIISGNSSICTGGFTQLCATAGCASYLWSTGAITKCIIVNTEGTYIITVTSSSGCSSVCTKTIITNATPSCMISGNSAICAGGSTQLCAPAGCASYLWNTGATTKCITVNKAKTYIITVTNSNGCSSVCTKTVTNSAKPSCLISGNSSLCTGSAMQLCAPIGCASYLWSTCETTRCIIITKAGSYTITVTNANGCSSVCTKTITATIAPSCNISGNSSICKGNSAQLCAPAGCASYLWSSGEITRCIIVNTEGCYFLTVTNSSGCSSVCTKTITNIASPNCIISGDSSICTGDSAQLCAPTGCASYLWNSGAITKCITVNKEGCYFITVTNSSGCNSVCSKTITKTATPSCIISGNSVICSGSTTQLCAPAGCASYLWSTCATTKCITINKAESYLITVTNSNGCSSVCTKTVTNSATPSCIISGNSSICLGQSTTLSAPTGCTSYLWSTGATKKNIIVTKAGTKTVTVTNSSGCSSTCSKIVTVNSLPECNITGNLILIEGQSTILSATPGTGYSYLWNTNDTSQCILVSCAGTYSVIIKNASGCISTCSVCVIVESSNNDVPVSRTIKKHLLVSVGNLEAQVYPNPFASIATIEFLSHLDFEPITVEAFNMNGKRVALLFSGQPLANELQKVKFDATNLLEGVYLYRITSGEAIINGRIIHIKK